MHRMYSPASVAKAHLDAMGLKPWREVQPGFPDDKRSIVMSAFFGGRSEAHLRRIPTQVLYCDLLATYPSVCVIMGLWSLIASKGIKCRDATGETRALLETITLGDLRQMDAWRHLWTLVEVDTSDDILPARCQYGQEMHYTTALNHMRNARAWYTLPDCIGSKLLAGKAPKVIRAFTFSPLGMQDDLKPFAIMGNPEYVVDPRREDPFRRIVDLRNEIKRRRDTATGEEREALDAQQKFLKILANAISYGIYLEINVRDLAKTAKLRCFGAGASFPIEIDLMEEAGRFFHPLVGALITGGARLMLAIAECLCKARGLDWAFCDTDSMAIAKPSDMSGDEFYVRARKVRDWFTDLNPYAVKEPLFKIEDANCRYVNGVKTDDLQPLHCIVISAKRYALYNLEGDRTIVIRKASAHGLGHFRPPYEEKDAPLSIPPSRFRLKDIGVERWQYDLWYRIIQAALKGPWVAPDYSGLPGFNAPAVVRYAATSPHLLKSFKIYNCGKPYRLQMKPFNFVAMFLFDNLADMIAETKAGAVPRLAADAKRRRPRVLAPFHKDAAEAAKHAIDRDTGEPVGARRLKTYARALEAYHLRPESKFENGGYLHYGPTERRLVKVAGTVFIGKEAHRLEEQVFLGRDQSARIEYGMAHTEQCRALDRLRELSRGVGQHKIARTANLSRQHFSAILSGTAMASDDVLARLVRACETLEAEIAAFRAKAEVVLDRVRERIEQTSLRDFARHADIDPGHLLRVLSGKRPLRGPMLMKLERALALSVTAKTG